MSMSAPINETLSVASPVRPSRPRAERPALPQVLLPAVGLRQPRPWWTLGTSSTAGMIASLVFHLALLTGLAYIVFESRQDNDFGTISGLLGSDENAADFIIGPEAKFEVGGGSTEGDLLSSTSVSEFGNLSPTTPSGGGLGNGDGTGEGDGVGSGIGIAEPTINVPSHAVTKGSFSAWTVPKDPEPRQPYFIVIQVRLPENLVKNGKFRASDITGKVTGTDTYKQNIRFKPTQVFPVKDGTVQIEILVPAAEALVKDTIQIQSRLLKEKQTLQIVF